MEVPARITKGRNIVKINRLFLGLGLVAALSSPSYAQNNSGDITIVLSSAVDVVEPCHMNSTGYIGQVLKGNVVETLMRLDPQTSEIKPNLATEWKQIDPSTWQVKLRQGVKFQDGTDFNADAVIAALNRQFSPELQCRDTIRLFGKTTLETKALDNYTVEIKSSTPTPLMPTTLSQIGMTAPSTDTKEATKK